MEKLEFRAYGKFASEKENHMVYDWQDSNYIEYVGFNGGGVFTIMCFIGIEDTNNKKYYIGDIGQFDNGDTFVIRMEDWLEVYVDWIGDAECEDQARDLYRIGGAKIIGNIYENPELLIIK